MKTEKMHKSLSCIGTVLLIFVTLVISAQLVCYHIPGWWEREYTKCNSLAYVNGEMSMKDAVYVTEQMLDYCIGTIDTLNETTVTIDGSKVPFFTEREKLHLADCREIFSSLKVISVIAFAALIAIILYLIIRKASIKTIASSYLRTTAVVAALAGILAIIISIDFDAAFIKFHHIFFDNDLWLLDPREDNLINIMQEQVFADTALVIFIIWVVIVGGIAILAHSCTRRNSTNS